MLKALELNGFKSFADRTRFEFPPGITVVVGPNGSGKSNIVDGIKWVLGEQSAKGLRGKDMADVIFKGSGSGGRKAANMAEATLVLDNLDRRFEFDADEIRVTRRVYRDGEGEYLINGSPCRLKDIRQLFRGTGAGTDAYSLIEQGKVDRMLQASPKDRRAIFEEAAGISRFKVKKIETQRRLARVEQNFLRLSDIVEEVENRLRTVRAQASKALRYRECTTRLQELRTWVGQVDWRRMTDRIETLEAEAEQFRSTAAEADRQVADAEAAFAEAEERTTHLVERSGVIESAAGQIRSRLSEQESLRRLHRARAVELEEQAGPLRRQWQQQQRRAVELQRQLDEREQVLIDAELAFRSATDKVERTRAEAERLREAIERRRTETERQRLELTEVQRQAGDLRRRRDLGDQERERVRATVEQLTKRLEGWRSDRTGLIAGRDEAQQGLDDLARDMASRSDELATATADVAQLTKRRDALVEQSNRLRSEHHGLEQRASVIEELERNQEGITAGVKQVLRRSRSGYAPEASDAPNAADGGDPFAGVLGMVADLIQVQVQQAGLVDTALGDMAQAIVVEGDELIEAVASGRISLEGRVVVLRQGRFRPAGTVRQDLAGVEGVIGRADQMIQAAPGCRELAAQLLGGTWIVRDLATALRLRSERADDVRYLTLDGQIVDVDGTTAIGPRGRGLGIVSRRSELRALRRDLEELEAKQDRVQEELIELRDRLEGRQRDVDALRRRQQDLSKGLADRQLQLQSLIGKLERVEHDLAEAEAEHLRQTARGDELDLELSEVDRRSNEIEASVARLRQELEADERQLRSDESALGDSTKGLTAAEVERAKAEQRLAHDEARASDLRQEVEERRRTMDELASQRRRNASALGEATLGQLAAGSAIAFEALALEQVMTELRRLQVERQSVATRRRDASQSLEAARATRRRLEGELHKQELELGQLLLEKQKLAERLADDYGIDIASIEAPEPTGEPMEREAIEQEIESLRRKINSIGAVNLDALDELQELEGRFGTLSAQYQDLVDAKQTLEKIIERINTDSRRLFAETLEAIRANFQVLYRRSFGGGKADLVIEPGVDILEAGIDIVATPPGKPEFSNSLLSGGEKALTAVSLLMAIFQHRPSPFCVLDEVDAPFDEANIGRFIDVLTGFLASTKFIIVTHSKKTMTAADTLYGVTMQESGISKRVSVRFEDVSDDGRIADAAIRRTEAEEQDAA
ncbi:MAG TPA: chromosome segregation protein SMC [Pirellulaceae bacterium]|nr:chromosome segregation protein SMC [Pirellulaceae bacterium]